MKKFLIDYYALVMMSLFIIYNLILDNLKISGLIYQVFMVILIVTNIIILIIFRKDIKCKSLIIVVYFFLWLFSKNTLQCVFGISSMITLIVIGFLGSNFIKLLSILITIFFATFSMPLFFSYLLVFGTNVNEEKERNDIYDSAHYYCENNYEVYSYSAGAMDGFHYSIGKYYEFFDIDGILSISYSERNEVSREEYNNYLNTHHCKLVGDIHESE